MSFKKRQNEYSDIPGFDASFGERIHRAFWKLLKKIQYLEQSRTSEKSKSEASHCSKDEDLTLTDIQYRLLILQLQYVRSLLRKRCNSICASKITEGQQKHEFPATDKIITRKSIPQDTANEPYSARIPSSSNSGASSSLAEKPTKSDHRAESIQATLHDFPRFKHSTEKSTTMHQRTLPSSSKPHYHLKLDDVPFILGASSTASHSVVANIQNIIAMMKSHNKALCGPKPNTTRSTAANTHSTDFLEKIPTGETSEENERLLNILLKDLCELMVEHKKMMKRIDAIQIKRTNPDVNSTSNNQNYGNEISNKYVEKDGSRMHRPSSTSEIKLRAEVKKKDFVKHSVYPNPKQSAYNVRPQTNNLSIMDRRKLLRSLQNFKKHLSAEDISWD